MKHRTTDPACVQHRPPTGWWSRWRFDRARGRSCRACAREVTITLNVSGADDEMARWLRKVIRRGDDGSSGVGAR